MTADELLQAWRSEAGRPLPPFDADRLLGLVRRDQSRFARMLFWRDVREIGVALVMLPTWIVMGVRGSLPWTWYLMVPVLAWAAGFMIRHRAVGRRLAPRPDDPLRRQLAGSLAEVDHQVRLLRTVAWWGLIPFGVAGLAFVAEGAWQLRSAGWLGLLAPALATALILGVLGVVGWLNRYAIRTELEPRRRELTSLLAALADEATEPARPDPELDPA